MCVCVCVGVGVGVWLWVWDCGCGIVGVGVGGWMWVLHTLFQMLQKFNTWMDNVTDDLNDTFVVHSIAEVEV